MRNAMWIGGGITGMGEIPMLGVKEKGIAKVIRDIFRNGEKGFFYDPSDMGTVYQDAAGTTAVNATGQPLGLVLDKSKQLKLGDELSKITSPFTVFRDVSSNITSPIVATLSAGKTYLVVTDVAASPQGLGDWRVSGNGVNTPIPISVGSTAGRHTCLLTVLGGSDLKLYGSNTGTSITVNAVSVRELKGNHAYQTTSAARPIFSQKPILSSDIAQGKEWEGSSVNNLTEKLADGRYRLTTKSNTASRMGMLLPLEAGKTYSIEVDVETTGFPVNIRTFATNFSEIGSVFIGTVPSNTRTVLKRIFTATDATFRVGGSMSSTTIDLSFILGSVSVKEVIGYRTDQNYIAYDGVDDKLITNLPTPLTNAIVLRAVPGVGTQVKYNQTLPVLYEYSTNHAGLIAIDRALTRQEHLRLMTELDKKAGATSLETLTFKVFDNNQQGFVYDPNDLSTMYQDAAGTVPVTAAGQPVGLILDKKNPALVGGEVDVDITNWITSGGINKVNKNTFSNPAAATGLFYDGSAIDGLKIIELHYTVTGGTVQICDALGTRVRAESTQPSGVLKAVFYPDRTSSPLGRIYFRFPTAGTTLVINKLIVHTYTGNHAFQTTSASRPILRQNAVTGANYLEFDGIDDCLTTSSFPTMGRATTIFAGSKANNSGTGAVVARAAAGYVYQTQAQVTIQSMINPVTVPINGNTVITAKYEASGTGVSLKVNNALKSNQLTTDRGYNHSTPVVIGAFSLAGASPLSGHIYALIGIAKVVSDDESAAIEKVISKRVGVTLNV